MKRESYRIRPAGRHILTIGSDLIKDRYAAVVELVKNAYDADSQVVNIKFSSLKKGKKRILKIEVIDEGHGMDFDDVINKWMVPSTDDKLKKKQSPGGRLMQGKKGIGRYAASILGDELLLETINKSQELTTLVIVWDEFKKAKFLEDVEVLIEKKDINRKSGTIIAITGGENHLEEWTDNEIKKLRFELKKLIPPIQEFEINNEINESPFKILGNKRKDQFEIYLEFKNFPVKGYKDLTELIKPWPLFDLYDYKISGTIDKNGMANLYYHNNRIKNSKPEKIEFKVILNRDSEEEQNYCGRVFLDLRVYDRDKESIDNLINRGLKDPHKNDYVGRREARNILNKFNGIGVYRNGFRIRPLGDAGYDWLELDKLRVQNPAKKIGGDQAIGIVLIQPEDDSNLEEKSARDGLKENKYFYGLKETCRQVLQKLEERRYIFRKKTGLGRSKNKISENIERLFDYGDFRTRISKELDHLGIRRDEQKKIFDFIDKIEEQNNRIAEEIKEIVAIYQKHATVGKIVNVILHEGRHPLNYLINQIPTIKDWRDRLLVKYDPELLEKVVSRLDNMGENVKRFVALFKKLDPLAAKKRTQKKEFFLLNVIKESFEVFENELKLEKIQYNISCDKSLKLKGWKDDFVVIFVNLIDNSIYWLESNQNESKKINVKAYNEENFLIIEYRDNGAGIERHLIESEVIFDPEFSTKTEGGAGLGLAIAGEAINRNNGDLKAIYSEDGAFFKLEIKQE